MSTLPTAMQSESLMNATAIGDTLNHVLSNKSYSQGRDIFVFWPPRPSSLVCGVNSWRTPVSSAALHRWTHLINPEALDFELRPVAIERYNIFRYFITPTAPAIPGTDTAPLSPGDYGMFPVDKDGIPVHETEIWMFHPLLDTCAPSFAEQQADYEKFANYVGDAIKLYAFPPSFEESVLSRDRKCFITGSEDDLEVSWIFPPTWAFKLSLWKTPHGYDFTPFIAIANAAVMRRDLKALFHDNAFGIDVDDDYRIVVFRDLEATTLPSRWPKHHGLGPEDDFLRKHFRWCLKVHFTEGDISEDYNHHDVHNAMLELGAAGREAELAPMDDERWNSIMGKEILQEVMRQMLAEKEWNLEMEEREEDV